MRWINRTSVLAMLAALAAANSVLAQTPVPARFVVVLDAAHGGADAGGKLAGGRPEKALTLNLSVRLRSLLSARGISVVTTREQDVTTDAEQRAEIADHAGAQACLTLHASESGSGIHLFVSSLTPVPSSRFSAWKTAQGAFVSQSLALAGDLNSAAQHAGIAVTLGRTPLAGVDSMACPAVAVEISPQRDANRKITAELDNSDYQARVTGTLAAALLEWRSEVRQP